LQHRPTDRPTGTARPPITALTGPGSGRGANSGREEPSASQTACPAVVHGRSRSRHRAEPTAAAVSRTAAPATLVARQRPVRSAHRTATAAAARHAPPSGPPALDRRGRAALGPSPAAGPVAEHAGTGRHVAGRDGPGHTGRSAHSVHRTASASQHAS